FKPGRKLTAYYDVELGGGARRPVAVTWTPLEGRGALPPEPELDGSAMQAEAEHEGLAAPFRRLRSEVPAWGMRLLVSPLDPRYPQLVRVSAPGHVRDMLSAADGAGGAAGTGARASRYAVTIVRYRPGQRHVLRYDPADAGRRADGGRAVFAKLYRDGDGARSHRVAVRVADWLSQARAGVTAARPLAYLPDDEVVLYPQVAGAPLSSRLGRPGDASAGRLGQAGACLRVLQQAPATLAEELPAHDFDAEVRSLARASEHVRPLLPEVGARIADLLDRARELHARLPQEAPAFAHGDYKADHLWVSPRGLTLIDFNTCSLADPALDVGKFLADLHWWHAATDGRGIRRAQQRFLEGYGPEAPPAGARMLRARLYEALVLAKITVRRVRIFDPDWAARTEALVDRADHLLRAAEELRRRRGRGAGVRA
ncbi:MAG TPA: aminoglycoside phosphotransferase family protein, partial [Actinomycetota bacterium]|nr:aminoglycoside phosphotransferase family protein [Actinomycetota bacterium]